MTGGLDSGGMRPRSPNKLSRCTASRDASDAATISASQEDNETVACFLEDQLMVAVEYLNVYPEVEWRTAQSESE